MSIDEVISAAYRYGSSRRFESEERSDKRMSTLREAIEQHVAEAVAKEREELLDLVGNYAKDNADLKDAVRARAEKETT